VWTLTVRRRGGVERERHPTLEAALARMEARVDELVRSERRGTEQAFVRSVEPVAQVAARAELRGPRRTRGGVDLRGEGTTEAFTGRVRRRLVERRPGETSFEALGRALRA
jgi:hypothetical protein